jgi:hypothetical protein
MEEKKKFEPGNIEIRMTGFGDEIDIVDDLKTLYRLEMACRVLQSESFNAETLRMIIDGAYADTFYDGDRLSLRDLMETGIAEMLKESDRSDSISVRDLGLLELLDVEEKNTLI